MQQKSSLGPSRIFSEAIKKSVVKDIEEGKVTVLGASKELGVSAQSVYKWLNKYSRHLQSSQRIVIEMQSEGYKTKELQRQIIELEAALGRKQLEIDYLNKMLELGKEQLGVDLKKKCFTPPFNGSENKSSNTPTK